MLRGTPRTMPMDALDLQRRAPAQGLRKLREPCWDPWQRLICDGGPVSPEGDNGRWENKRADMVRFVPNNRYSRDQAC